MIQEKCWCTVSKSANLLEHLQVRHNLTICEDFWPIFRNLVFVAFICLFGYFFAIFDYIEENVDDPGKMLVHLSANLSEHL